jgi:hypothetical protein
MRKGRPLAIKLPQVNNPQGVTDALAAIVAAMGDGTITAEEAFSMCAVLESQRRAIETEQMEARMLAIEEHLKSHG